MKKKLLAILALFTIMGVGEGFGVCIIERIENTSTEKASINKGSETIPLSTGDIKENYQYNAGTDLESPLVVPYGRKSDSSRLRIDTTRGTYQIYEEDNPSAFGPWKIHLFWENDDSYHKIKEIYLNKGTIKIKIKNDPDGEVDFYD